MGKGQKIGQVAIEKVKELEYIIKVLEDDRKELKLEIHQCNVDKVKTASRHTQGMNDLKRNNKLHIEQSKHDNSKKLCESSVIMERVMYLESELH